MLVARTRNVRLPKRGTERSAGLDFFVPEFKQDWEKFRPDMSHRNMGIDDELIFDWVERGVITVEPHSHVLIPSGIMINLETVSGFDYTKHNSIAFIAFNKSSVGSMQLDVAACVGDEDFQGELHLSVTNTSSNPVEIPAGMKLVQFVLIPIRLDDPEEVSVDELFKHPTKRGSGSFGHTNLFEGIDMGDLSKVEHIIDYGLQGEKGRQGPVGMNKEEYEEFKRTGNVPNSNEFAPFEKELVQARRKEP